MIEQLTAEEECTLILDDVFNDDKDAQETCLQQLAELQGLTYADLEETEIQELVIENEDTLYSLSNQYNAA